MYVLSIVTYNSLARTLSHPASVSAMTRGAPQIPAPSKTPSMSGWLTTRRGNVVEALSPDGSATITVTVDAARSPADGVPEIFPEFEMWSHAGLPASRSEEHTSELQSHS